jgi:hypothetical protein
MEPHTLAPSDHHMLTSEIHLTDHLTHTMVILLMDHHTAHLTTDHLMDHRTDRRIMSLLTDPHTMVILLMDHHTAHLTTDHLTDQYPDRRIRSHLINRRILHRTVTLLMDHLPDHLIHHRTSLLMDPLIHHHTSLLMDPLTNHLMGHLTMNLRMYRHLPHMILGRHRTVDLQNIRVHPLLRPLMVHHTVDLRNIQARLLLHPPMVHHTKVLPPRNHPHPMALLLLHLIILHLILPLLKLPIQVQTTPALHQGLTGNSILNQSQL